MVTSEPHDPFVEKFFSRIQPAVARSFTPAQIAAIRLAFGGRVWGIHAIDIRLSIPLLWRRYYVVFLAGKEQRSAGRRADEPRRHPLASLGNAIVTVLFIMVIGIPILLSLLALQAALGVKPGGGSFIDQLIEQLDQLFK